jgi:hypothetical protein
MYQVKCLLCPGPSASFSLKLFKRNQRLSQTDPLTISLPSGLGVWVLGRSI